MKIPANEHNYFLVITLPDMPQIILGYKTKEAAIEAAREGIKEGIIESESDVSHLFVHTRAGSVYTILSKESMNRMKLQNQLMQTPGPSGRM